MARKKTKSVVALVPAKQKLPPMPRHQRDAVPKMRRDWWRIQNTGEMVDQVGQLEALRDVTTAAMGHLMSRLVDKKTPAEVKDRIALALAPRVQAEFKGRLAGGSEEDPDDGMAGLMGTYRVS